MAPFMENGGTEDLNSVPLISKQKPKSHSQTSSLTSILTSLQADVRSQANRIPANLRMLGELSAAGLNGGLIDDRKYLIENVIQSASSLPNTSGLRNRVTDTFVSTLWDNLRHPPLSYLGDEFRYRMADGSRNNVMYPNLGASGSHYARTVVPKHPRPAVLPDPGLIFDSLLVRQGPAKEHPTNISSNLIYFATILAHDLYHIDEINTSRVKSSSYLDLGPLYGHNYEEQSQVRTFADGLLKPDTFAEKALLMQPPGVCALIIAFNRFHNYVVTELARINEAGRFDLPVDGKQKTPDYVSALEKRDEALFQTGRLVTCAVYVSILLNDYLRTILNLNDSPTNSDWSIDPRRTQGLSAFDSEGVPRGVGNQVSAEFSMMYRWNAAASVQDEEWREELHARVFGTRVDPSSLPVERYMRKLRRYIDNSTLAEVSSWAFGDMKRDKEGFFSDADLVKVLQDGCENIAGAFGAHNTPKSMRTMEILNIQQGREWGVATLNELRTFFKLKPYTTFAEVNTNPEVAETLEALYTHPDNIELYVGLQAEEAKKPFFPGSGLCPGFTMAMGILSDAVSLVRGDRFYTIDYSPIHLTNFGFNLAESNADVASGGVMYKLLMRAFPGWYGSGNSVYALYPFTTPKGNREIFGKHKRSGGLDFERPEQKKPAVTVAGWKGVTEMLKDHRGFRVPWGEHTFQLMKHHYMLSDDLRSNAEQRAFFAERMYRPQDAINQIRVFYESITAELVRRNSKKLGDGYHVDIVRDVCNIAHAYFVSEFFNIPMKPDTNFTSSLDLNSNNSTHPSIDAYTPKDLSDALGAIYSYIFQDNDPTQSYEKRILATHESKHLSEVLTRVVSNSGSSSSFILTNPSRFFGKTKSALNGFGPEFVKRLREGGKSIEDVVGMIIPTAAAACAMQAMGWAQMIDLYLSDEYRHHWPAIQKLAESDDPSAFEDLKRYVLEAYRLSPPAPGTTRLNTRPSTIEIHDRDSGRNTPKHVDSNTPIFLDFILAGLDRSKFPEPREIKLNRPLDTYIHYGWGQHSCLGRAIVSTAGACFLRVLGKLSGLKRMEGRMGEMNMKWVEGDNGHQQEGEAGEGKEFKLFLSEDGGDWKCFPCTSDSQEHQQS
ncbi:heme peroxidase [Aspergillus unguis]